MRAAVAASAANARETIAAPARRAAAEHEADAEAGARKADDHNGKEHLHQASPLKCSRKSPVAMLRRSRPPRNRNKAERF